MGKVQTRCTNLLWDDAFRTHSRNAVDLDQPGFLRIVKNIVDAGDPIQFEVIVQPEAHLLDFRSDLVRDRRRRDLFRTSTVLGFVIEVGILWDDLREFQHLCLTVVVAQATGQLTPFHPFFYDHEIVIDQSLFHSRQKI